MDELMDWQGSNPYYLMLVFEDVAVTVDLDRRGWIADLGELMRKEGTWHLFRKEPRSVVFSMAVLEGEQPYYVARHIGRVPGGEVTCYGIGKKRLDGHSDRLWVLPNGQVVGGDDAELFARGMI